MENTAPQGVGQPEGKIAQTVEILQGTRKKLTELKAQQDTLRASPDRPEKNALLDRIETDIRETTAAINDAEEMLGDLKSAADAKYTVSTPDDNDEITPTMPGTDDDLMNKRFDKN